MATIYVPIIFSWWPYPAVLPVVPASPCAPSVVFAACPCPCIGACHPQHGAGPSESSVHRAPTGAAAESSANDTEAITTMSSNNPTNNPTGPGGAVQEVQQPTHLHGQTPPARMEIWTLNGSYGGSQAGQPSGNSTAANAGASGHPPVSWTVVSIEHLPWHEGQSRRAIRDGQL